MVESGWIKRYRQGSYRSAPFFMESHTATIGRGKVVHEFPGVDGAEIEDTGRLPQRFSLNVFILADDYFSKRDTLVNEIEQHEKGLLVHPYLGSGVVQILSCSFSEVVDQGRMVRFTISAIQDSDDRLTKEIVDTKTDIFDKRDTALEKINEFFNEVYTIVQAPIDVANELVETLDVGVGVIDNAKKIVSSHADFKNAVDTINARKDQLIFQGEDLANEFQALILYGADARDEAVEGINLLTGSNVSKRQFFEIKNIADSYDNVVDLENPNSIIDSMYLYNAVVSMSGLLATINYESQEEAIEIQSILFPYFDRIELDNSVSNDLKESLRDLRESVYFDSDKRTVGLGDVYNYEVLDTSLPSVTISNSIYGDLEKEQNIIERNDVTNPFFISGTVTAIVNNE